MAFSLPVSDYQNGFNRRRFMHFASGLSAYAMSVSAATANEPFRSQDDPFLLGVASGDPDHQSVVLWTRLATSPLEPGGGIPPRFIDVQWEVADDVWFSKTIASGTHTATPQLAHSVHVEVDGLEPDRWYFYRFRAGNAVSPVGRTRTMPAPHTLPDRCRFAVTSCQNYEQGWFTAYAQMARDEVDLVFHLGDYIYEYEAGRNGKVRTHIGNEIQSLDDYRIRHSQYRLDPLLNAMHAAAPWIVTWDDHEFDNNCAGEISEEAGVDPVAYLARRANAYQAYYEMMPIRSTCMPRGADMRLYRQSKFGRLVDFQVLDTRQYRTDQPNDDRRSSLNDEALAQTQSMLGREQRGWLYRNLLRSQATWNVLAQQVMMGMVNRIGDVEHPEYSMDQWPGYSFERMELMRFMRDRSISNPVVLTGDIHCNFANELRVDDRQADESPVATEFVATSLSSGGNGVDAPENMDQLLSANPCVKFHNLQRGYILCDVTPNDWQADYRVVDQVTQPGGTTTSRAKLVVESGSPSIHDA
ncbi:alkaline phosphatase D family protein [Neorhodopirellula pilleata]|uniref:Alkaline phosphatase D n=1 Tax=Neorhodopirellula pilleata TaxID=2714738 RepID=A0A5C5ZHY6_9BACT|nr:alkaline phosphatase D family protein [Neorhodopirellula pilleata]TWT87029.1 Alkaline phosphatase D precursor [Neorhodopirellula pilleata]